MELGIKGKTALVFGAAGGLGGAIAQALAAEGANIVLADINAEALAAAAEKLQGTGALTMAMTWDLADLSVIDANIGAIEDRFGGVEVDGCGALWLAGRRNRYHFSSWLLFWKHPCRRFENSHSSPG